MTVNKLILGDNLEILKNFDSESVDLIYLDPPFFSNKNYEVIWGDKGEIRSFEDRWAGGVDHYIAWLKERVIEMHRILKNTGSIYLHCDWHADAYIRVYILDKIFGQKNFRNEITWKRLTSVKNQSTTFTKADDKIFFYSKSNEFTFNKIFTEYKEDYVKKMYNHTDKKGRKFTLSDFTQQGQGPKRFFGKKYGWLEPPVGKHWIWTQEKINQALKSDEIYFSKNGIPRIKRYLDEKDGMPVDSIWTDILNIQSQSKESIGYPTQKPEALLERIIRASSNEGDIILDPFVGGGTTVTVADRLKRRWIGIDQSVQAIKVSELRLSRDQLNFFQVPFTVQLHKYDYDTLRYKDAFEFEEWIISQFQPSDPSERGTCRANTKQRGDFGLDGRTSTGSPIQVKRSDDIGRNVIDNFLSAVQRYDKKLFESNKTDKKPVGYIIAFSFGKGIVQEIARLKNEENIIIKLVRVDEIVPIAKKPKIFIEIKELERDSKGVRELEFIAKAESEAGIEFYSWDFEYKENNKFNAQVLRDKAGIQKYKFNAGEHEIAVKVIDNDGLEEIEIVKLRINGKVETI